MWMVFQSREDDENGDGKSDILYYQMDMPLLDSEQVYGVELLLIFDYKLYVSYTLETVSRFILIRQLQLFEIV